MAVFVWHNFFKPKENINMKLLKTTGLSLLAASVMLASCVSNRKYLAATSANADLQRQNAMLQGNLNSAEDTINHLRGNVDVLSDVYKSTNDQLNMSKEQIAAQQRRLMQLQELISQQQKNTEALRQKIADALVNFNTNELSVSIKNGRVYVSMQESLLFPSGSAVVNQKGKDALAKLAGVLNTTPDINVDIEGHTDTVPISNKLYPDNWALSVARATSIARILINDYTVNPMRITASGRSEYDPVASNSTPEGRAQNRRTEIILEPKLDQLMDVLRGVPVSNR